MVENLLAALLHFQDWRVLLALLVGSVGGVIIGAIPGVATFSMEPLIGLTMMLGIYGASMYGGALPAVLFKTPGTPVNALTTYDGYPITKAGEPLRAVTLAYSASFVGGVLGIIALIIFAPILADLAAHFGAKEIFLTALLGLILVIVTHRDTMLPTAMLVGFGMFLATIGLDRSTYSHMKEIFQHKRVASFGAACGVTTGIIPGVGEFLAQFISYNYAKKTSRKPELFGNGSPEGLVACEAANNPVPAAALVPLLSLGIPGEALTAMMLSVFYVHNVVPGPTLFEQNMDFVLAVYISLLVMNVLVVIFLIFATNPLMYVMKIPNRFLGMLIMILGFVGVYTLRNSITDCFVAAAFGLLGVVLSRQKLPVVPIILGMVLGGIMENKLKVAMARVDTPFDFIDRPVALILFVIICTIIIGSLLPMFRKMKSRSPNATWSAQTQSNKEVLTREEKL